MSDDALRYGSAGVDIDASNAAKNRIKKLVESTFTPGVLGGFGGFGGMVRVPAGLEKPILVSSADGVGTKNSWFDGLTTSAHPALVEG